MTGLKSTPENEGWSGWEGQPPGPSGIEVLLTPAGELGVREDANWFGSCQWGVSSDLTGLKMSRLYRHWGATPPRIVDGMNDSCWTTLKKCWEVGTKWCRSLLWRWAEVLCQWLPRCLELVNIGGGCGLLGRVGRYRRKI